MRNDLMNWMDPSSLLIKSVFNRKSSEPYDREAIRHQGSGVWFESNFSFYLINLSEP